jgi:hypothetical protein
MAPSAQPTCPSARGAKDRGSKSVLRESLLRKDLVYSPRRGLVDFTVPLFAAYLRQQHPLASFTDDSERRQAL